MKITIETIDNNKQRYPTIGDWLFDDDNNLNIFVSETGNNDYNFLIGIHEAIEAYLCQKRNISEESVSEFDIEFEKQRLPNDLSEPGDNKYAPYKKEHIFATNIERLISEQLNINWQEYEDYLDNSF